MKIDVLKEVEEVVKEWEVLLGNCYDFRVFSVVICGYVGRGMEEKVEVMFEDLGRRGKGIMFDFWGFVVVVYVEKGVLDSVYKCLKMVLDVEVGKRKWRFGVKVVISVLSWVGDEGSLREVESFVVFFRNCMGVNREMYYVFVKVDIREGGSSVDILL